MNNAFIKEVTSEEESSVLLREKIETTTEIVEALQNITNSSFWKVIKKYVFDVDLEKAKRSLAKEKDTTELFRLQGQILWGEKYDLEKLLKKYRDELLVIKEKL